MPAWRDAAHWTGLIPRQGDPFVIPVVGTLVPTLVFVRSREQVSRRISTRLASRRLLAIGIESRVGQPHNSVDHRVIKPFCLAINCTSLSARSIFGVPSLRARPRRVFLNRHEVVGAGVAKRPDRRTAT